MAIDSDQTPTRNELRAELEVATRELKEAEAARKRDAALHRDRISDIKAGINTIIDRLDAMENGTGI